MDMPYLTLQLSYKLDNYDSLKRFLDAIKPLFPEQTTVEQSFLSLQSKTSNYDFSLQDSFETKTFKGTKDFLNAIYKKENIKITTICIHNREIDVYLTMTSVSEVALYGNDTTTLEDYERKLKKALEIGIQENEQLKIKQDQVSLKNYFEDLIIPSNVFNEKLVAVINERILEIEKAINNDMPLAATFLIGSTLEGVLSALAQKYPREFNTSVSAPKKDGKVLPISSWVLSSLIDVANEIKVLERDVKDFSEKVRDYRNFIHPNEQVKQDFSPTMDTVKISLHVFKIALNQINAFIKHKSDG